MTRRRRQAGRPCPTPWKTGRYRDRIEATLAAERVMDKRPDLGTQEPYPCACRKWHLRTTEKRRKDIDV